MKTTLVRTAVSGGALALTLGVAGPALACMNGDVAGPVPGTFTADHSAKDSDASKQAPSLADVGGDGARLDARIARWLSWIDDKQAALADSSLDPDLVAAKLATLQAWEDKLTALRAQIAAATTVDEIKTALQEAGLPGLRGHGWGWFKGGFGWYGDHRHHGKHDAQGQRGHGRGHDTSTHASWKAGSWGHGSWGQGSWGQGSWKNGSHSQGSSSTRSVSYTFANGGHGDRGGWHGNHGHGHGGHSGGHHR